MIALQHVDADILQMDVVDPVAPTAHALERVATAEDEVAGVEGEAHVGAGEE